MSRLEDRLAQDRELRDAARAVLMADIELARTSFTPKGVANRVTGRIGDGAKDVFEVAKAQADDNRGIIAVLIGAILVWLAREPILEILGLETQQGENDASGGDDSVQDFETRDLDDKPTASSQAAAPAAPPEPAAAADGAIAPAPGDDNEH